MYNYSILKGNFFQENPKKYMQKNITLTMLMKSKKTRKTTPQINVLPESKHFFGHFNCLTYFGLKKKLRTTFNQECASTGNLHISTFLALRKKFKSLKVQEASSLHLKIIFFGIYFSCPVFWTNQTISLYRVGNSKIVLYVISRYTVDLFLEDGYVLFCPPKLTFLFWPKI